jgi:hypothetical protein
MLSSIGFHISSLSASLLSGRSWPGSLVGKPEARRALDIAEVLRSSRDGKAKDWMAGVAGNCREWLWMRPTGATRRAVK